MQAGAPAPCDFRGSEGRAAKLQISLREVDSQALRVGVRPGDMSRPSLLVFNGIGANIELLEPFLDALPGPEAIIFDVPEVGGSPAPALPYRPWMLARLSARLLDQLGREQVDMLVVSWEGRSPSSLPSDTPSAAGASCLLRPRPGISWSRES
jgi:hypothetical protein